MFVRQKPPLLGIDISSSSVNVLGLGRKGSQYCVEFCASEPLPAGAIVNNRIENHDDVAHAIRCAVEHSGTQVKEAAVAVPASASMAKILSLPASLSDRELERGVFLEAENHIPYQLAEVCLDFEKLGPSATDVNAIEILLIASRREHVESRSNVVKKAGLKLKLVDVETYSIERAFAVIASQLPLHQSITTVAIVDIGINLSAVYVLVNGSVTYSREHDYAQTSPPMSLTRAEISLAEGPDLHTVEPSARNIAMTVARILQFYFSASTEYQSIDHILLAGSSALISGVAEAITTETGVTTSIANPFVTMQLGARVETLDKINNAPSMLIACGLAMRRFD